MSANEEQQHTVGWQGEILRYRVEGDIRVLEKVKLWSINVVSDPLPGQELTVERKAEANSKPLDAPFENGWQHDPAELQRFKNAQRYWAKEHAGTFRSPQEYMDFLKSTEPPVETEEQD